MFATPNITCLQHRKSTSTTSKLMFATSKIFRSNFETFTWNARNMSRTRMQHIHNDCNDKRLQHDDDQLQHAMNIVTTPNIHQSASSQRLEAQNTHPLPHGAFSPGPWRRARWRGRPQLRRWSSVAAHARPDRAVPRSGAHRPRPSMKGRSREDDELWRQRCTVSDDWYPARWGGGARVVPTPPWGGGCQRGGQEVPLLHRVLHHRWERAEAGTCSIHHRFCSWTRKSRLSSRTLRMVALRTVVSIRHLLQLRGSLLRPLHTLQLRSLGLVARSGGSEPRIDDGGARFSSCEARFSGCEDQFISRAPAGELAHPPAAAALGLSVWVSLRALPSGLFRCSAPPKRTTRTPTRERNDETSGGEDASRGWGGALDKYYVGAELLTFRASDILFACRTLGC
jgi:hypothetical protein